MDHKLIRVTAVIAVANYGGKAAATALCAQDFVKVDVDAFVLDWNETDLALVDVEG